MGYDSTELMSKVWPKRHFLLDHNLCKFTH